MADEPNLHRDNAAERVMRLMLMPVAWLARITNGTGQNTMSEPTDSTPRAEPLRYGTNDGTHGWLDRARGDVGDRVHGFVEFLGILIGIAESLSRIFFAIGIALICLGLGGSLRGHEDAPEIMMIGGLLAGLAAPLPWRRSKRL